jgi:hypothetical protein
MIYVPPADLTGWFFNSDGFQPFPMDLDPSQPWTSADNLAALNYWLGVVPDFGQSPDGSGIGTPMDQALNDSLISADEAGAPEPPGWRLFLAGLLLIGAMAEIRRRRIRRRYA